MKGGAFILLEAQWQAVRRLVPGAGKMATHTVEKHLVELLPVVTWNVFEEKKFEDRKLMV